MRDIVEKNIWWERKGGTSSTWYDNWTKLGPSFLHQSEVLSCHPLTDIDIFLSEDSWDYETMQDHLSPDVVEHVRLCIDHVKQSNQIEKPWLLQTSSVKFIVKSASELIRNRSTPEDSFNHIWVNGLPFKICFVGWRVWMAKVPVAAVMATWNPIISQLYLLLESCKRYY
ncbi:hypothetical protein KY284_030135 [Solanum tuberosum]|nr:hypothetical protein KY284_030135 [Solanum tuberosum]